MHMGDRHHMHKIGGRLRRFIGISKNTGFFEKPVFRFYQSPSIEKPKIPKKKDEKL